jgi:hypothetical protein
MFAGMGGRRFKGVSHPFATLSGGAEDEEKTFKARR